MCCSPIQPEVWYFVKWCQKSGHISFHRQLCIKQAHSNEKGECLWYFYFDDPGSLSPWAIKRNGTKDHHQQLDSCHNVSAHIQIGVDPAQYKARSRISFLCRGEEAVTKRLLGHPGVFSYQLMRPSSLRSCVHHELNQRLKTKISWRRCFHLFWSILMSVLELCIWSIWGHKRKLHLQLLKIQIRSPIKWQHLRVWDLK